jgi:glutamate/tyrosine decarboxylase-like PLP-dependent enzyme
MLTRRRFLGHTALGMLAVAGGCVPQNSSRVRHPEATRQGTPPLLAAKSRLIEKKNLLLGFPINMTLPPEGFFAWRRQLAEAGIGLIAYNNVGDPFEPSPLPVNTHDIEGQVILDFARLYGFPPNDIWGFISHSGTDSNMHGMYMGRTILKARTGVTPKAFFTAEAHYSVEILQDLLGLDRVIVGTQPDGSMDPDDLRRKLAAHSGHPALVVATTGTTFKGAIDPLDRIRAVLQGHPSYVHLDAALFGGYLPYTVHASEVLHRSGPQPSWPRYDSIAVSCHKFFGFPAPAGLFITTASTFEAFHREFSRCHNPEYIRHVPGTITCSRDSVKPGEFHWFTTDAAKTMLAEAANAVLQRASWLFDQMGSHLPEFQPVRAGSLSNTIYFRQPNDAIVRKYSLATMQCKIERKKENYAHVVVMPHANREVLSEFLEDLKKAAPMAS